jgi:alpha-galactosidase
MGKFLREQTRDIVFSLCQYGMADVWKWGGSVNGNCWRTTGDIVDTWKSMSGIGFKQDAAAPFAKPGNWNDPDMLIVGEVGWGKTHPTRLTPDEQYTHISLWCLLAAPLLIGCDMEKFDDFTLNLLSNDEVLAVDQDELGKAATCVMVQESLTIQHGQQTHYTMRVYEKRLADGSHAVGFFNLGAQPAEMSFRDFAKLNVSGQQIVRDLWQQKNVATLDTTKDALPLTIPAHGVLLYKFTAVK